MDRSQLILTAIEELKQIRSEIRLSNSLDMVRRSFDRLQEIRRQHVDDFDVQIMIADAQQEAIERARTLRKASETGATDSAVAPIAASKAEEGGSPLTNVAVRSVTAVAPPPVLPEEPLAAEIPPEVPKLDHKSWQLAVGLAVLFTVGIFASFFYLIQTARRLNFDNDISAPAAAPPIQAPGAKSGAPPAKPQPVSEVAPAASTAPALRLYTDLTAGTVVIDDQPPKDLGDGELNLDSLTAGVHSVRVDGRGGSAGFTFSVDGDDAVPRVNDILKSNNAMVVLVSVKDGAGRLTTDVSGAQVALDEKPAGVAGPEGLLLSDLGQQDHDLVVSQAGDRQKFVLTYTPAPTLTVFVKSDPSTGVLTVSTGQDGVSVFINDAPYKRVTVHGEVRIPLKVGVFRISVHKDGFIDPDVTTVSIKKNAEASVQFHMIPATGDFATLQIKGAQPGTVAYLDHQVVSVIGADGNVRVSNVKPGAHLIELHHEQAITKQLARSFEANQVITLSGADVALDRLAADNKSVIPGSPSASVIPPPEVPTLQPAALASITGEQVHKGGGFIPYHTPKSAGSYYFQAHTKLGGVLKHGKLQWYAGYRDKDNYVLFSLDGKHAEVREVRDGKALDLGKIPFNLASDEWVQVEMSVKADGLQARAKSGLGDWVDLIPVSANDHDLTKDSVGLYVPANDEVAVANFRFSGH